jgi:large subunit ribosomal protein L23
MNKQSKVTFALYDVLRYPLVSEKTTRASENNQVVFAVNSSSTKTDIKKAVEEIYKVKVKSVNTLNLKGKKKVFRGRIGIQSDLKKAYVVLESGQNIDMATGI